MTDKKITDLIDGGECRDGTFDLSKNKDLEFINNLGEEQLDIAGAVVNIFKLLGIHEQGSLVNLAVGGTALSSSDQNNFPASNAFNALLPEWKSGEKGPAIIESSFLGYDFGPIKYKPTGRDKYGIDTKLNHHITTIRIRQGCDSTNRVTQARMEYSLDGSKWFGAAMLNFPDDSEHNQLSFKTSAPARYWRIRPLQFNGSDTDTWKVQTLELVDYRATALNILQDDMGFLEARDRDYQQDSIRLKAHYDLIDVQSELTRFGIELPSQQIFLKFNFASMVRSLGRPIVIGDILELPSETQYTPEITAVLKYLEVTDVSWAVDSYTPGWQPTAMRIIAQPLLASQETLDIIDSFAKAADATGFMDIDDSNAVNLDTIEHGIISNSHTDTPVAGGDTTSIYNFSDNQLEAAQEENIDLVKLNVRERSGYVEDGLPPNNLPYTEGADFPTTANAGDFHRLTYTHIDANLPARLYKFNATKSRWVFCETDRRAYYNGIKPINNYYLDSEDSKPLDEI